MRLILETIWNLFLPLAPDSWLWKPFICPDIYPEEHRDMVLQDLHRSVRSCNKGTMLFIFWEEFLVSYMLPFLWIYWHSKQKKAKPENNKINFFFFYFFFFLLFFFFFLTESEGTAQLKGLLFIRQKTWIWFWASTWWFTTVHKTTSFRRFHTFFWFSWSSSAYIVQMCTCRQTIHT